MTRNASGSRLQQMRAQLKISDRLHNRVPYFQCFQGADLADFLVLFAARAHARAQEEEAGRSDARQRQRDGRPE